MSSSSPIFISNLSEERWVKHMTLNYTKNLEIDPCVFRVPQSMKDTKPEAYTPQVVGLGPYHHFQPKVQQMERQKREAVKKYFPRRLDDFIELVNEMTEKSPEEMLDEAREEKSQKMPEDVGKEDPEVVAVEVWEEVPEPAIKKVQEKFEATIRSSYDRYLDLDRKTLSWVMVVDGIFLLHVVNDYVDQIAKIGEKVDAETERLFPDILMLENQIPVELLKLIRTAVYQSVAPNADIVLFNNFTTFCNHISPLKLFENSGKRQLNVEKHMLHYMYQLIVENDIHQELGASASSSRKPSQESPEKGPGKGGAQKPGGNSQERRTGKMGDLAKTAVSPVTNFFQQIAALAEPDAGTFWKILGDSVNSGYERVLSSGVKVSNNIEKTVKYLQQVGKNANLFNQTGNLVLEIDIPTVSQLDRIVKMKFAPTNGGINSVDIDWDSMTLKLPVITLHKSSEVILRNLVAYEVASAKPGQPLKLTEYLDLMCGMIDTETDVELLKNKEIIKGSLSPAEIVSIFNAINKSTKGPQKIVDDVNEKFRKKGIVKAYNSVKKFLASSQGLIMQLFPLLVLILLTLQYVCDIRGCGSRGLGYAAVRWDSSFGDGSSLSLNPQANYLVIPRKMLRNSS